MSIPADLQERAIKTIRFLSADGVQQANSGHPGLPMGTAAIAYAIWMKHLRFNPQNPDWENRDRFILSGGHGSMLLYSLLHLTGYALPLEELKRFRQWESLTPGHPEFGVTPGVETTTGPLGQGFTNGVGMAIAEAHLAAEFNRPEHAIVDHFIYAIVTDGDLMEGITSEAASLAGHLKLGKLIYLYDDNRISIEGSTEITFTENRGDRFKAYGWQVLYVKDGNNVNEIDRAIRKAKKDPRPSLIICRTTIGYGLPTRQGTAKAHGEPPGDEELNNAKKQANWPVEPRFYIPKDVLKHFRTAVNKGKRLEKVYRQAFARYQQVHPQLAAEYQRRMNSRLPVGWDQNLPEFPADAKGIASRSASQKVINSLAVVLPELMGGSADLAPSTNTLMANGGDFQAETPTGRNMHFGVREHAMGGIVNGMMYHRGLIPYGATFMVFSDYLRPAVRISAISHLGSIWVFTHDSIAVGEDGPTHQPVEHLATLRAIPNLVVLRPGDANEVREAWKVAIERRNGPTVLAFSRQPIPTLDRSVFAPASGLCKGAYVLKDFGNAQPVIILMACGSEMPMIAEAGQLLADEGIACRVVSFPSWELFAAQDQAYQDSVLPPQVNIRMAVEMGVSQGWEKWVGSHGVVHAFDRFGASAQYKTLYEQFGFNPQAIVVRAKALLNKG